MKHIPVVLTTPILFFVLLFLYTRIAGPLPLSVSSVVTQKTDTFTVQGEGKASMTPDMATVSVGVQSNGSTVKATQADLNQKMNAVIDAIKSLGIDAKDLQTTNYSINPSYDYSDGRQRIVGYQAMSTVMVKIKDLDKTNEVIDTATAQGANNVSGITFDVEDKTQAENKARQEAVYQARRKAEAAAQIAGFKLGKIVNYSENFGGPIVRPMAFDMAASVKESVPTQVESGSQELTVTVSLSYELQ